MAGRPSFSQRGHHEAVRVLARGRTEQQRVGRRHAVQAMARIEQAHEVLELLVLLHAHTEVAHDLHHVVVAGQVGVRDALDGRGHPDARLFGGVGQRAGDSLLLLRPLGGVGQRQGRLAFARGLVGPFGQSGLLEGLLRGGEAFRQRRLGQMLHLHEAGAHAQEVLRDHVGHVFQVLAREAELLQLVQRHALQLLGAPRHFVRRQVGLHLLEDVFRKRTFLEAAGKRPGLLQAVDGILFRRAGRSRRLFEGGQVQVHAQDGIACGARLHGAAQIVCGRVAAVVSAARRAVRIRIFQHGPTSIRVVARACPSMRKRLQLMFHSIGVGRTIIGLRAETSNIEAER